MKTRCKLFYLSSCTYTHVDYYAENSSIEDLIVQINKPIPYSIYNIDFDMYKPYYIPKMAK